ncbi:MAG TPA: folate-binding protein [Casimicrobiaceae bacterium]
MSAWTDFLSARGASFDGAAVTGFGEPAAELSTAREAAVLCDLGAVSALAVEGREAATFLQGQLTNDVEALALGASQLSAWCSPKGRVLANFLLHRLTDERFELLLPGSLAEPIRKRLSMFVLRSKVTIADAGAASVRIGVGGPAARACLAEALGATPLLHRAMAIDGGALIEVPGERFIALVAPERAPSLWGRLARARAAGFPCWQWLTVRAGVAIITPPTQDQFVPQMLNLDALGGISFRKGCYSGQEIVARMQYLGRLKERLALMHVDGGPPREGTRLFAAAFADQPCGTVVNAAAAPGGGADLLAVAQLEAIASESLRLGATDGPPATLLPLPYALPAAAEPRGRLA